MRTRIADGLTGLRLVIGLGLIPVLWDSQLTAAAVLLSVAWLTDFLDGRIARRSGVEGRLGRWDMEIDTAVGVGLLIGMVGPQIIPVWAAATAIVVLGGLFVAGNLAAAMLLQLAGYLPFIGKLWADRPQAWWLPLATVAAIGIVDRRRLVRVNIPNFVHGVMGRFEAR